jgi:hypothetical protein
MFDILNSFPTLWDMFKIMVIFILHKNENCFLNNAFDMLFWWIFTGLIFIIQKFMVLSPFYTQIKFVLGNNYARNGVSLYIRINPFIFMQNGQDHEFSNLSRCKKSIKDFKQ